MGRQLVTVDATARADYRQPRPGMTATETHVSIRSRFTTLIVGG